MRTRTRRWPILASGVLVLSLMNAPAILAAEPSADDPVATMNGLLDTLVAKDFAGVGAFVCAEKRDLVAQALDFQAIFAAMGEGIDADALIAGMTVTIDGRGVTEVSNDGTAATVALTGTLRTVLDEETARGFVRQILEAQGMEVTDEVVDQFLPMVMSGMEAGQDLSDPEVGLVREDGIWLVCDDFAGVSTSSPEPTVEPAASLPPMDPAAYERLLAAIPAEIRVACEPDSFWQVDGLGPEPGEIAAADCDPDGSGGMYVTYSLFDSAQALDAFYDIQLEGTRNLGGLDGPGCPDGPGEVAWEQGRRFCYATFADDANTRWTHDALAIAANAIDDDGDWARLEEFFRSAGPVAP